MLLEGEGRTGGSTLMSGTLLREESLLDLLTLLALDFPDERRWRVSSSSGERGRR